MNPIIVNYGIDTFKMRPIFFDILIGQTNCNNGPPKHRYRVSAIGLNPPCSSATFVTRV
jgi:hypothetical protein